MTPKKDIDSRAPMITSYLDATTNRYNKKLFVKATMDAMLRCWETLVMNAKTDPQLNINVVPVVSDYDANTLIRSWNDTDKVFEPKLGRYTNESVRSSGILIGWMKGRSIFFCFNQ